LLFWPLINYKLLNEEKYKMNKATYGKYKRQFFILCGLIMVASLVFLLLQKKTTLKSSDEFNKEINNLYSFFVNKNSNLQNKKIIKIKSGDSLQRILLKEGIPQSEINKIYSQIVKKFDLKKIQQGQDLKVILNKNNNQTSISRLSFQLDSLSTVHLYSNQNDYAVKIIKKNLEKVNFLAQGAIQNSLYGSASKVGVDPEIIIEFARIFGFEIDFQRDIRANDEFKIFYERYEDDDKEVQKNGNILFAYMKNNGKEISLYRFTDQKKITGYYTADGKSIEKALMKTPINGARLSSVFGFRRHPILGYNKLHQGTDFAAPRGTPIMASGSGTIEKASWFGAYGKYVRIRHNSTYKTAYAHLSGFGKGIKSGSRVQQGQIIGYVGSTGRSTGPHLHYEVLINNKRVNSQKLNLPSGKNLTGVEKQDFENIKKSFDKLLSQNQVR
jgi:murein DD-endopeptidase MepM/ murein hydrolase activator NlpD